MSMWADYINECGILNIIEKDWGWITYHIDYPTCVINDSYVRPGDRSSGKACSLEAEVKEIALKLGCSTMSALVHKDSLTAQKAINALHAAGYEMKSEDESFKLFSKEIGG